jgi:hypothetical protein
MMLLIFNPDSFQKWGEKYQKVTSVLELINNVVKSGKKW